MKVGHRDGSTNKIRSFALFVSYVDALDNFNIHEPILIQRLTGLHIHILVCRRIYTHTQIHTYTAHICTSVTGNINIYQVFNLTS